MSNQTNRPGLTARVKDAASRGPRYFISKTLQKLGLKNFGKAEIAGRLFRVPIGEDGVHQLFNDAEPWLPPLVKRLLEERIGCFVDVGANVGQTLLVLKAVEPARHYIGFEPSSGCVEVLQKLIDANKINDAEIVHGALSDAAGTATLFADNPSDPAASIVDGFRDGPEYQGGESEQVELLDGAAFTERLSPCALLKVDVEGAELEVLAGLKPLLQAEKPAILCEVLPVYDAETEAGAERLARQTKLEELLSELGYSISRIKPNGQLLPVDSFGIHSVLEDSNYLFLPAE